MRSFLLALVFVGARANALSLLCENAIATASACVNSTSAVNCCSELDPMMTECVGSSLFYPMEFEGVIRWSQTPTVVQNVIALLRACPRMYLYMRFVNEAIACVGTSMVFWDFQDCRAPP
jgi:hypothetical protein